MNRNGKALAGCWLDTRTEPCAMCAGAFYLLGAHFVNRLRRFS